jgi:HSP20 family protein
MYHFELKPFRRNWNPTQEWEKEMEKLIGSFSHSEKTFAPAFEIIEEERSYLISIDVPGLKKEDLDIEVKDNHLHISGERKLELESEKQKVIRSEKRYGKFSKVFTIPQNVKPDAIAASFENGVLFLVLPKEEKSQTKKITISDWKREELSPELKS